MIFSVIVPFLNEEVYIERCIRSLLTQDFNRSEYELIFVDNSSTDRSIEIARRFPEVILLSENKRCSYAALNKGLMAAKGRIIAFTDADCAVSKDWLNRIYDGMYRVGATIVLGKCSFPEGSSGFLHFFEDYENAKVEYVLNRCCREYFFGYTRNMAVRAEVFKRFGNFIETPILADTEFIQRCVLCDPNIKVAYLNDMCVTHMEITNIKSWLNKIYNYGGHSKHKAMPYYQPLNYRIKLSICTQCIKENNYRFIEKIMFLFLLMAGDISYKVGRVKRYMIKL
ncbi:MAG: glycosyltransferase [Candidatus Omnitrophica bacterium]|nr:glycosyltransferase [Candidatus Omnitrophota bacterium]